MNPTVDHQDIEPVYMGGRAKIKIGKAKTISLPEETMRKYEEAVNPDLSFKHRLNRLLAGETGKGIGLLLDVAVAFTPFRKPINKLRTLVKRKAKHAMPTTNEKPKRKSKTIIVFGLLFVAGLLQHFGVDLGLELSPDAKWVTIGASLVGIILRLLTDKPVKLGNTLQTIFRKK